MKFIKPFLLDTDAEYKYLDSIEIEGIINSWRRKFKNNKNPITKLSWQIFSHKTFPCFEKEKAILQYEKLKPSNFYILFSLKKIEGALCFYHKTPTYYDLISFINKSKYKPDIYIIHEDYDWIFIITHDVDFGPYLYK